MTMRISTATTTTTPTDEVPQETEGRVRHPLPKGQPSTAMAMPMLITTTTPSLAELLRSKKAQREESNASFLTVIPGESLADTAAQNGVMGTKAFRAHEK